MLERRTFWKAVYQNGNFLLQFNADGSENKYTTINRAQLSQFVLYRDKKPMVVIHLNGKKRLIYRMRRAMNNHGYKEIVYIAGWQETTNGVNTQMISFLFEDNHIEIVDQFYEDHSWFYSVNFIPEEVT